MVSDGLLPQGPYCVLTLIYRPDKELAGNQKTLCPKLWEVWVGVGWAAPEPHGSLLLFELGFSKGMLGPLCLTRPEGSSLSQTPSRATSWHGSSRDIKPRNSRADSHSHGTMTRLHSPSVPMKSPEWPLSPFWLPVTHREGLSLSHTLTSLESPTGLPDPGPGRGKATLSGT